MPNYMTKCPYCRKNITTCSVQLTPLEEIFNLEEKQSKIKQLLFKKVNIIDTYRCLKTGESYRVNRKTREVIEIIK